MKLISLVFILIAHCSFAQRAFMGLPPTTTAVYVPKTYYVAANGNDLNDGLSTGSPITSAKISTLTLNFGDAIKFNRGDTFVFGDFSPACGTLTFEDYGSGALPKFYGSTSLTAATWTSEGSGVYSTTLASAPTWVWVNGVAAKNAQTDWINITAQSGATLTGSTSTLNALSNFIGAKLRIKEQLWVLSAEYTITGYNSGTGVITVDRAIQGGGINHGFFIYNQQQFITESGEFYYSSSQQKLYLKSAATPAGTDVRAGTYTTMLNLTTQRGIKINNLEITQYINGVNVNYGHSAQVTGCTIHDVRSLGIDASAKSLTLTGNTIYNCDKNGIISSYGLAGQISSNTIHDIDQGLSYGYTGVFDSSGNGIGCFQGDNDIVELNVIYNTGYTGIFSTYSRNATIQHNTIYDFLKRFADGSAIYTTGVSTADINYGHSIAANYIYNGIGSTDGFSGALSTYTVGVYIDNYTRNVTVTGNTIVDIPYNGILSNWDTKNSTITNNNIIDCVQAGVKFREASTSVLFLQNRGNILTGNKFSTRGTAQYDVEVESYNNDANFNPFSGGGSINNNGYSQPYIANICIYRATNGGALTAYTLSGWQTKMGGDGSSTGRTNYITFSNYSNATQEVMTEVNMTASSVQFNVPAGYSDITGVSFSNPVTIPAWSSLVYLKNTAFP